MRPSKASTAWAPSSVSSSPRGLAIQCRRRAAKPRAGFLTVAKHLLGGSQNASDTHQAIRLLAGSSRLPDDLVGAALLLCSDAGSYINGVNLLVDGGFSVA
jgi:hypothetical protein